MMYHIQHLHQVTIAQAQQQLALQALTKAVGVGVGVGIDKLEIGVWEIGRTIEHGWTLLP